MRRWLPRQSQETPVLLPIMVHHVELQPLCLFFTSHTPCDSIFHDIFSGEIMSSPRSHFYFSCGYICCFSHSLKSSLKSCHWLWSGNPLNRTWFLLPLGENSLRSRKPQLTDRIKWLRLHLSQSIWYFLSSAAVFPWREKTHEQVITISFYSPDERRRRIFFLIFLVTLLIPITVVARSLSDLRLTKNNRKPKRSYGAECGLAVGSVDVLTITCSCVECPKKPRSGWCQLIGERFRDGTELCKRWNRKPSHTTSLTGDSFLTVEWPQCTNSSKKSLTSQVLHSTHLFSQP
jgi:hypothetical protein